jgi:hypothetical protein
MTSGERQLMQAAEPALEVLRTALETDVVLPLPRVLAMTGLSHRMLSREFHISEILIETSANVSNVEPTGIVSPKPLTVHPNKVRHLLGIAAMRRELGVSTDNWSVYTHVDSVAPDAEWTKGNLVVAIEFDAGFYSTRSIQKKVRLFQAAYLGGVVWGSCTKRRDANVLGHLADAGLSTPSLVVNWRE